MSLDLDLYVCLGGGGKTLVVLSHLWIDRDSGLAHQMWDKFGGTAKQVDRPVTLDVSGQRITLEGTQGPLTYVTLDELRSISTESPMGRAALGYILHHSFRRDFVVVLDWR